MREVPVSDLIINHYNHYLSSKEEKSLSDYSDLAGKTKRNKKGYNEKLARQRAMYIAEKLNNPSSLLFYLKCAWNLTDEYLDRLLGIALTKEDPILYFSAAASREMQKNG